VTDKTWHLQFTLRQDARKGDINNSRNILLLPFTESEIWIYPRQYRGGKSISRIHARSIELVSTSYVNARRNYRSIKDASRVIDKISRSKFRIESQESPSWSRNDELRNFVLLTFYSNSIYKESARFPSDNNTIISWKNHIVSQWGQ